MVTTLLLATIAVCAERGEALAQTYPISQRGGVTQNVALTAIAIEYSRPFARGRTLFGQLIPWDSIWHPGADSATIIRFSSAVHVQDKEIAAGEYSIWLIPRQSGPWTVILSKAARVFHRPYPGQSEDALRFDVTPESGAHMETLAVYFPVVNREEAVLRIHWGDRIVPIRIRAPAPPLQPELFALLATSR